MKHIVFYSGGIGSWATAKRVIARHGKENVILLFTDTLIEDYDLYRFIEETVKEMGAKYIHLKEGRTPWELFSDIKYIGNSRIAPCSRVLKQEIADDWIKKNFKHDECVLYLGIDWTEMHRTIAPVENYAPYRVEFPMCEEPYLTKDDMILELEKLGIKRPRLYEMGFTHNNCGGFCVRAGQGHFAKLLKEMPELYKYHEEKEQEVIELIGKDVSILRRNKNNVRGNITLRELREEIEAKQIDVDHNDIGGCGCFAQPIKKEKPTKEELFNLIKTKSFTDIGKMYDVSDNAIRKWCKKFGLPYRKKDIKMLDK